MPRAPRTPRRLTRTLQQTSVLDTLGQHLQKIWGWYVTILVVLAGAILTSGPNLFLFQLATQYPLLWIAYGVITLLALLGLALIIWEWRRVHPTTQRVQYLEAVKNTYNVVPLVIDAEIAKKDDITLPEEVYQTLRYLHTPDRPGDEVEATTASSGTIRVRTIKEFFDREADAQRTLVILGRPGGGKTTLLRQSMVAAAQESLRASTHIPIYVELPNFARFLDEDEAHALQRYLEQRPELDGITSYAEQLQQRALAGEAYLFLDGLDEVAPGPRKEVTRWIQQKIQHPLITLHAPQSGLIIGTRFTVYSPFDDLLPQKTELVAQLLDVSERDALAQGLFPALYAQLHKQDPTRARRLTARYPESLVFAQRFVQDIAAHPQHDLLGGNPLLFSLAAYVYVNDEGALPQSRVLLYQRYITVFLKKVVRLRQRKESKEREELAHFDATEVLNEVISVMAAVARWLLEQSTGAPAMTHGGVAPTTVSEFVKTDITQALEQVRVDRQWSAHAGEMLTWVLESGLLATINADQGRYKFQHQTYLEYLTAVALAEALVLPSGDMNQRARATIAQHQFDPRWLETMSMLPGALIAKSGLIAQQGRVLAREWLQHLANIARDPANAHADDALHLAVASFADIPQFETFGTDIDASALIDAWASALLRLAQTADAQQIEHFQQVSEKVALLPATFTDQAIGRLQTSLGDDARPEQQIAAARAVEGMGNLVTDLAPLTRLLEHGMNEAARVKAARALTKLKRYDANRTPPEYAPGHDVLIAIMQHDGDPTAVLVARSLKESGRDAESLLPWVIAHTDPQVRTEGAFSLGSMATETAKKQLQQLSRDTDARVAATAMGVLSRLQSSMGPLPLQELQRIADQGFDVSSTLRDYLPASLRRLGYQSHLITGVVIITPPVAEIPAGPFLMGIDKKRNGNASDDETLQQTVTLHTMYWIAQHPLTVAEYARFIDATPHSAPQNWEQQMQRLEHPVVNISWEDTRAYVEWVADMTGEPWAMPSQAQWEKAARGTAGRIYPWGNTWDSIKANTFAGGPGDTTPMGSYPDGQSPYGVYDMAGNVWEWTRSVNQSYPYDATDGREEPRNQGKRVLRGGSWSNAPGNARATYRHYVGSTFISRDVGARVVCGVRPRLS